MNLDNNIKDSEETPSKGDLNIVRIPTSRGIRFSS